MGSYARERAKPNPVASRRQAKEEGQLSLLVFEYQGFDIFP
jgi:hypothetical protein